MKPNKTIQAFCLLLFIVPNIAQSKTTVSGIAFSDYNNDSVLAQFTLTTLPGCILFNHVKLIDKYVEISPKKITCFQNKDYYSIDVSDYFDKQLSFQYFRGEQLDFEIKKDIEFSELMALFGIYF